MKLKIVVASTNPVKINATRLGFKKMFPKLNFTVKGVKVGSGVSDQPMSEKETMKGATNRTQNANKKEPTADFWVGIEGGIKKVSGHMETFALIIVKSKEGVVGKGSTGSFLLPKKIEGLIKQGKELGDADDIVFGRKNSKQSNGSVGILTHDAITRTAFYEPAVVLALIPFKNPELY